MSGVVRGLFTQSNQKLGKSVFHFDLPAGKVSCPGRTPTCSSECYAQRGRFNFPQVQDRLRYNLWASKRDDFVPRAVSELYRKGALAVRWMVSGDVYSPAFARKLVAITSATPFAVHWLYTRSWRIPAIESVLRDLAQVENVSVWYSADQDAAPMDVPPRVRVAYMKADEQDYPAGNADLVFLVQKLRRVTLPLANVCVQETPAGREAGVTCATCQLCFTQ